MTIKKPSGMDECLYFTNRALDGGSIIAWVFRKECPKCKQGIMGKPKKKDGKINKKAEFFECYSCNYRESNEEVENGLTLNIEYKCQHCGNAGETTTEYERKNFLGVKAYVFECQNCKQKIGITQKMKDAKKKSGAAKVEDSDGK